MLFHICLLSGVLLCLVSLWGVWSLVALGWSGRRAMYYEGGLCGLPRELPKSLKRGLLGWFLRSKIPVLASDLACLYSVCGVLLLALGGAMVEYNTEWFRDGCDYSSDVFRGVRTAQKKWAEFFLLLAWAVLPPRDGEHLNPSSLPHSCPADRRIVETRVPAAYQGGPLLIFFVYLSTYLSIYLSIYIYIYLSI